MASNTVLSTDKYTLPGTYIGEDIEPGSTTVDVSARIATYVAKGSRYIYEKNDSIVRGYISSVQLSFTNSSPYTATLSVVADGDQDNATVIDSHGIEVSADKWYFNDDNLSIVIADSVYSNAETYYISYQGADASVVDAFPTDDVRVIDAIGSQVDHDQYARNTDYYVSTTLTAPTAKLDSNGVIVHQTNNGPTFTSITHVGTSAAAVSYTDYSTFTHKYSRGYVLTVKSVTNSAGASSAVFSWTAAPISAGNGAVVAVPISSSVAAPTFTVDSSDEQTLAQLLEYGISLNFVYTSSTITIGSDAASGATSLTVTALPVAVKSGATITFGAVTATTTSAAIAGATTLTVSATSGAITSGATGTYVNSFTVGDTYSFNAYGPSLIELDGTVSNTNQYASVSSVSADADNSGTGKLSVSVDGFTGTKNLSVSVQVIDVDAMVGPTNPTASITFSAAPADGGGIKISNGHGAGSNPKTVTFEFDDDSTKSISGSTLVTMPTIAAIAATGSVVFTGAASQSPVDGTLITLVDGVRSIVFEFDDDNTLVSPSATRVLIGSTPAATAANFKTAITASALTLIVRTITSVAGTSSTVTTIPLTNSNAGSLGNVSITTGNSYTPTTIGATVTVSGMTGGVDSYVDLDGTISALVTAINDADLSILAAVSESDSNTVVLSHGLRLVLSAQPTAADTFAVAIGDTVATTSAVASASATSLTVTALTSVIPSGTHLVFGTVLATTTASAAIGATTLAVSAISAAILSGTAGVIGTLFTFGSGVGNIAIGTSTAATLSNISTTLESSTTISVNTHVNSSSVLVVPVLARDVLAAKGISSVMSVTATVVGDVKAVNNGNVSLVALNSLTNTTLVGFSGGADASNSVEHVTLAWAVAGDTFASGSVRLNGTTYKAFYLGASAKFTTAASKFAVGDAYSFTLLAPRTFTTALDDRTIDLTVRTVGISSTTLTDPRYLKFGYSSNTQEGGSGVIESFASADGYFVLPGHIKVVARNTKTYNTFAKGDQFTLGITNDNKIHWDLNAKASEGFTVNDLLTDRNGTVTGTYGGLYLSLANVPFDGTITVLIGSTSTTEGTDWTLVSGTSIIYLASTNSTTYTDGLTISYTYAGDEPALGTTYYVTGKFKRPSSYYNTPKMFTDIDSAKSWLAPYTTDNHLAICADIAWAQNNPPQGVAFVQVEDADDDGAFSPSDIDNALAGMKEVSYITDIVPVGLYKFWSKFLAFNVKACDPFQKREHIQYFGAPTGTAIGDASTPGSEVYLAKNTLRVYGKSYAHGTRIMVGPRSATKEITLTDGTITTVALDGSFVAAATAAFIAGLPNYSSTALKQQLLGLDTIETFGKTTNETLGDAGIIFFSYSSAGTYLFEEDLTTDTYASEFKEILPMRTKQDVTRTVRAELDASVIGMVPNTQADATSTIKSQLKNILLNLINKGVIAPYQDDSGNTRSISDKDIKVFVDSDDLTLYNFFYDFYTRFAIKRLYGVYSVNKTIG
jgi:hypothetical protein